MFQPDLVTNELGEQVPQGENELTMSDELPSLIGTAVYFIRSTTNNEGVTAKTAEIDICSGKLWALGSIFMLPCVFCMENHE